MTAGPRAFAGVESCVEATIQRVGRQIRLGTPLGLGKANHLVNESASPKNPRQRVLFPAGGSFVNSPLAQQQYVSSNYTHVVRDILNAGIT